MTDDETPDEDAVGGDPVIEPDVPGFSDRVARREALKKAAVGAAVAGAVWTAPKVEGLSIVPDYAAAGTATAQINRLFVIGTADFGNNPAYYGDDAGVAGDGCNPIGDDNFATAAVIPNYPSYPGPANAADITITNTGPTQNAAIEMNTAMANAGPSPTPVGTVKVTMAQGADADIDVNDNNSLKVEFTVDPPFNKCRVSSATMEKCGQNNQNNLPLNNNPAPGATNPAPGNFIVGVDIPGGPGQGQAEFIRITVTCDP